MLKHALSALLAALCSTACILPATPREEDSFAPRDAIAQLRGSPKHSCSRKVQVLPAHGASRPFRSVASISATCSPGTPSVCEQHLRERACELGGDAVIMSDRVEGAAPATGSTYSLVARAGQVVRWLDAAQ